MVKPPTPPFAIVLVVVGIASFVLGALSLASQVDDLHASYSAALTFALAGILFIGFSQVLVKLSNIEFYAARSFQVQNEMALSASSEQRKAAAK